jgi:hypothetical protein
VPALTEGMRAENGDDWIMKVSSFCSIDEELFISESVPKARSRQASDKAGGYLLELFGT